MMRTTLLAVAAGVLLAAPAAQAHPGKRSFERTYPYASRLCNHVTNGHTPKRLAGFRKVELQPGATESVELRVDPRLLGMFSEADKAWRIAPGNYQLSLGHSSADLQLETAIELPERSLPVRPPN